MDPESTLHASLLEAHQVYIKFIKTQMGHFYASLYPYSNQVER